MTTWRRGRDLVAARLRRAEVPMTDTMANLGPNVLRVAGTAVYLFKDAGATPPALLANLEHHTVLHDNVLLVAIEVSEAAYLDAARRVTVSDLGAGVRQVVIRHGFMEEPNVVAAIGSVEVGGRPVDPQAVTYFLGDEMVIASDIDGMHPWREHLFVLLDRGADSAARFFDLPVDRVVTIGTHVEI